MAVRLSCGLVINNRASFTYFLHFNINVFILPEKNSKQTYQRFKNKFRFSVFYSQNHKIKLKSYTKQKLLDVILGKTLHSHHQKTRKCCIIW